MSFLESIPKVGATKDQQVLRNVIETALTPPDASEKRQISALAATWRTSWKTTKKRATRRLEWVALVRQGETRGAPRGIEGCSCTV